jgi:hypothetical protein
MHAGRVSIMIFEERSCSAGLLAVLVFAALSMFVVPNAGAEPEVAAKATEPSRQWTNWLETCRRRAGQLCEEAIIQFGAASRWKHTDAVPPEVRRIRTVPFQNMEMPDQLIRPYPLWNHDPTVDPVPFWNSDTLDRIILPDFLWKYRRD